MSRHPLAHRDPSDVAHALARLVTKGVVRMRELDDGTRMYDCRTSAGDARFARGLMMRHAPSCGFVSLPMPMMDEVCGFVDDMSEYHRRVEATLPPHVHVQPKHDGTCVIGVCRDGQSRLATASGESDELIGIARRILGNATWQDGTTLVFELIAACDPKLQRRRARDGLYLLYGATTDGVVCTREELIETADALGVYCVKQQTLTAPKVMEILRSMDDVDSVDLVQEGMVIIDPRTGRATTLRSWLYLKAMRTERPSPAWLDGVIHRAASMEQLHTSVEEFTGVLDDALRARLLLVERLRLAAERIDAIHAAPCAAAQGAAKPSKPRALDAYEEEDALSDDGLLRLLKQMQMSRSPAS